MPTRSAHAEWNGAIDSGSGRMEFGSGAYEGPYSFQSRMQDGAGTNPEELIGAAHAGCFSMALSVVLGDQRPHARVDHHRRQGQASSSRARAGRSPASSSRPSARCPGMDEDAFVKAAEAAKENCPVSVALRPSTSR